MAMVPGMTIFESGKKLNCLTQSKENLIQREQNIVG